MTIALGLVGRLMISKRTVKTATANGEDRYCIGMAVAGFGWEEIDVTQQGNTLIVMGQKADQGPRHLENGILAIDLFARSLKR
jgi:HSP20 family molecular chaperone IbpA